MSGDLDPTPLGADADDPPSGPVELLSGWGNTPVSASHVLRPTSRDDLSSAGKQAGPRGIIARGLGRAYGDSAMNAGGTVVVSTEVAGLLELDEVTGLARVLAGTSLDDLMRAVVPRGWFPPVTPGTRYVTIGGAIANDIHGKDHHAGGSFCKHVRSMVLAQPDGTCLTLTPETHPEEFWATCGGMGLTGTVVEATVALYPIETSLVSVDTDRVRDLDTLLGLLVEGGKTHRYSVAWVDLLAKGPNLGRSILIQGNFATVDALPDGHRRRVDPLHYDPMQPVPAPPLPSGLLNRVTIRAANELWFRKAPKRRRDELQSITRFFYPLDLAGDWSRIYGRQGFLQWQCLIPFGHEDTLREVVESLANQDAGSFLTVVKYFGAADPGYLSFPGPGWTLSLDVPSRCAGLAELLDRLDRQVAGVGGRLYFAKDSRMRPDLVPVMYPQLGEWREIRERMDPDRRLVSDLARRLRLLGSPP
ncbi:MAG TPA: FAD-binding oxidoreductase [Acidimicrobiales bacterium]|nr:FAD-binding oxidoreductase [Acidimicrobiales bacterium]